METIGEWTRKLDETVHRHGRSLAVFTATTMVGTLLEPDPGLTSEGSSTQSVKTCHFGRQGCQGCQGCQHLPHTPLGSLTPRTRQFRPPSPNPIAKPARRRTLSGQIPD